MGSITWPNPTWAVSKFHQESALRPRETPGGLCASSPDPSGHLVQTTPLREVARPIRPVDRGGRFLSGWFRSWHRPWYHMTAETKEKMKTLVSM